MKIKKTTIQASLAIGLVATSANAAVISSALEGSEVGTSSGAFPVLANVPTLGGTVGTVTTNVVSATGSVFSSNNWIASESPVWTFRAVDASNGLDVTYTVAVTAYRHDASASADVVENGRANGGFLRTFSFGKPDRDEHNIWTTGDNAGDYEILLLTASLASSDGATPYTLDGFTTVRVFNTYGFSVEDANNGNTEIGTGGTAGGTVDDGTVTESLDATTDSIRFVATAGTEETNSNRFYGFAMQFTAVPEPSSLLLLGLGSAGLFRRRRLRRGVNL